MASTKERKLKIAIVILSVLLIISLSALAGLVVYYQSIAPTVVKDNVITTGSGSYVEIPKMKANISARKTQVHMAFPNAEHSEKKGFHWKSSDDSLLKINARQEADETSFVVENMFPGDALYKEYYVQVCHRGRVNVHFTADVRPTNDPIGSKLEEVLMCKVEVNENKLYDGLMRDIPSSIDYMTPNSSAAVLTEIPYRITVYLDGASVGNSYMNKELIADFRWWVLVEEEETATPQETVRPSYDDDVSDDKIDGPTIVIEDMASSSPMSPSGPDVLGEYEEDGKLAVLPMTGDITPWIIIGTLITGIILIILLIVKRRKEEEDEQ